VYGVQQKATKFILELLAVTFNFAELSIFSTADS